MIHCDGVSKVYRRAGRELLRSRLARLFRPDERPIFFALRGVSLSLRAGESLAVIGSNGAGKSTLLSLIAGLSRPDEGRLTVRGRICPLLQLGAGFHPDLTGRENVSMNGALLGLGQRRLEALEPTIVDFAGIGEAIDEPLRTYSSGMVLRLAFSVAIHVDPEILLIDEVLSVGDAAFQQSCLAKIVAHRRAGRTLVIASHDLATLDRLCDRALWLEHGAVVQSGSVGDVLAAYRGPAAAAAL